MNPKCVFVKRVTGIIIIFSLLIIVVTFFVIMLMCHKVTHKKLIDNSPLFRKNFKVEFHGSHTNCVASFA